ncbi:hypothetical protein DM02DRAFT_613589 [Periconia macrospinosa]|uniref:Uncharacterized protein n=1 Tax=Periconia macrospinosa TaxID=97972 RepID=A0A2V1DU40_9PLEO|nr:hypothetical protein DM02DRAFT_613589 [Periconia macrospinosa]
MASPSSKEDFTDTAPMLPYTMSYYTCRLRNASVNTAISINNNVQSIETSILREEDVVVWWNGGAEYRGDWRNKADNYFHWYNYLDDQTRGAVVYTYTESNFQTSNGSPVAGKNSGWGGPDESKRPKMDPIILGAAKDYQAMRKRWLHDPHPQSFPSVPNEWKKDKNLTALIEEFSLNASLSLMSDPEFCEQVETKVNRTLWVNKYTYEPQNLLIAYGCSILACLLATIAGCCAIYTNGESYDNHFSTISRAVQSPDIALLFNESESPASATTSGARWKEDVVARTRIRLHVSNKTERFRIEGGDTESKSLSTSS